MPEEVEGAAAAGDEGEALAGMEGLELLPTLGPGFLALGAGVGVGTEVCNLIGFEGCFSLTQDETGPNPEQGEAGYWQFVNAPPLPHFPGYTYYGVPQHGFSPEGINSLWAGYGDVPTECGGELVGASQFISGSPLKGACGTPESFTTHEGTLIRSGTAGRTLSFTPGKVGGLSEAFYSRPPLSTVAAELAAEPSPEMEKVGEGVAHGINPEITDPLTEVAVPGCDELTWGACRDLLEEAGLEPAQDELTWETAELDIPPDVVTKLKPAEGAEVAGGSKVTVTTNPDKEGMPLVVPAPKNGETYSEYIARLSPGLSPHRVNVGEASIDPSIGPSGVVRVHPEGGTRLDPSIEHEVEVQTNPDTSPAPATGFTPPSITPIDLSPIAGISTPCTVFPFGLFCWFGEAAGQFGTSPQCPEAVVPIYTTSAHLSLCSPYTEQFMTWTRDAILFGFTVGLGFLFARGTRAIGDD